MDTTVLHYTEFCFHKVKDGADDGHQSGLRDLHPNAGTGDWWCELAAAVVNAGGALTAGRRWSRSRPASLLTRRPTHAARPPTRGNGSADGARGRRPALELPAVRSHATLGATYRRPGRTTRPSAKTDIKHLLTRTTQSLYVSICGRKLSQHFRSMRSRCACDCGFASGPAGRGDPPPGPSASSPLVQEVPLQPTGAATIWWDRQVRSGWHRPSPGDDRRRAGTTRPARSADPAAALKLAGAVKLQAGDRPLLPTVSVKSVLADRSGHVPGSAQSVCLIDRLKAMP